MVYQVATLMVKVVCSTCLLVTLILFRVATIVNSKAPIEGLSGGAIYTKMMTVQD